MRGCLGARGSYPQLSMLYVQRELSRDGLRMCKSEMVQASLRANWKFVFPVDESWCWPEEGYVSWGYRAIFIQLHCSVSYTQCNPTQTFFPRYVLFQYNWIHMVFIKRQLIITYWEQVNVLKLSKHCIEACLVIFLETENSLCEKK